MTTSTTSQAIAAGRAKIAYIGRMLFDRHLTDAAGGNISCRVGDVVCLSASKSGFSHQWQIEADDVLVVSLDGEILEGDGELSRETRVHLGLYREFGDYGTAVIHAHPRNLMVFASMAQPLPPAIEAACKFGITPVIDYAPATSAALAHNVIESIHGRESLITKHAAATIAPWHGVFVMGRDLDAAFDAVERLDTNAYCIIMGRMLAGTEAQERARQQMEALVGDGGEE